MAPDASNLIGKFLRSSSRGSGRERSKTPSKPDAILPLEDLKLLGTVDVRETVLAQREKRLAMGLIARQDGSVGSGNVELESPVISHQSYKWEIDPTKLVLKKYIAKGTYGTVHRGFFCGRDVAGGPFLASPTRPPTSQPQPQPQL